jgi:transposase
MTRRYQQYPRESPEWAVRMVAEVNQSYDSQWAAIGAVAQKLGVGTAETVRKWVRQAEVDAGQRPGTTSDESAEIKRLKRENAELRRANEILKAASAFFAAELDRPSTRS